MGTLSYRGTPPDPRGLRPVTAGAVTRNLLFTFQLIAIFAEANSEIMDAGSLAKYIKEMIGDRDKVKVPGLGVFYARMMPARFSDNRTTIYPPYRRMSFRKEEVDAGAGGEFVEFVADKAGLSREDADTEISWCTGRIKSELSGSRSCILPGLGEMRANSRNDYFFVPDDDLDIFPDGLGLEPVCIKMNQEAPEPAPEIPEPVSDTVRERGGAAGSSRPGEPAADGKGSDARRPEPEPEPEPEPAPAPKRRSPLPWILLAILGLIILVILFVYLFHDSIPALDNLLNRMLYSAEERELLGF